MKYTTFTFNTGKKNNSFNINNGSTNYSKALDDIILSNLKSTTPYIFKDATLGAAFDELNKTKTKSIDITINSGAKSSKKIPTLLDAINYFKSNNYNFTKLISDYPTYHINGTPITIFEDEIQIGYDLIPFNLFDDYNYINGLSNNTKKTIIDIYITIKK